MVKIISILILLYTSIFADTFIDSTYWMNSANSSGIGLAVTAQTNHPDAVFFNPASLTTIKKTSLNLSYTSIYDTEFSTLSFTSKIKGIHMGIGTHFSQSESIEKTSFDETNKQIISNGSYSYNYYNFYLSAASRIPYLSFLSIGASYNLHQMGMDGDTLKGETANWGILLKPSDFISLGLTRYYAIPFKLTWVSEDRIDNNYLTSIHDISEYSVIGLELKLKKLLKLDLTILSDYTLDQSSDESSAFRIGTKLNVENITLLSGYNHRYISVGVGTQIKQIRLNYSLTFPRENESLDNRHSFGLNYNF
ncbi:MAG: hypothetical protein VW397_05915 [Candidatus Margulisiibacteriota bacterium]